MRWAPFSQYARGPIGLALSDLVLAFRWKVRGVEASSRLPDVHEIVNESSLGGFVNSISHTTSPQSSKPKRLGISLLPSGVKTGSGGWEWDACGETHGFAVQTPVAGFVVDEYLKHPRLWLIWGTNQSMQSLPSAQDERHNNFGDLLPFLLASRIRAFELHCPKIIFPPRIIPFRPKGSGLSLVEARFEVSGSMGGIVTVGVGQAACV